MRRLKAGWVTLRCSAEREKLRVAARLRKSSIHLMSIGAFLALYIAGEIFLLLASSITASRALEKAYVDRSVPYWHTLQVLCRTDMRTVSLCIILWLAEIILLVLIKL